MIGRARFVAIDLSRSSESSSVEIRVVEQVPEPGVGAVSRSDVRMPASSRGVVGRCMRASSITTWRAIVSSQLRNVLPVWRRSGVKLLRAPIAR